MTGIFYENVKKDPGLRLLEPLSPARWSLYITSQWDPKSPWSDVRVRQAASLAIDRKALAGQVQKLIYEKSMLLPLTSLNSPTGVGPRIKGDPFKIQPLIWFAAPFEDIELQNGPIRLWISYL